MKAVVFSMALYWWVFNAFVRWSGFNGRIIWRHVA